jgi:hypothetical protein
MVNASMCGCKVAAAESHQLMDAWQLHYQGSTVLVYGEIRELI